MDCSHVYGAKHNPALAQPCASISRKRVLMFVNGFSNLMINSMF